jgi:hypothetical protein
MVTVSRFLAVGIPVRVAVGGIYGAGKRWYKNRHCHSDTTCAVRVFVDGEECAVTRVRGTMRIDQRIGGRTAPLKLGSPNGRGATPATMTGGCAT